jgi:hypothetical protein
MVARLPEEGEASTYSIAPIIGRADNVRLQGDEYFSQREPMHTTRTPPTSSFKS